MLKRVFDAIFRGAFLLCLGAAALSAQPVAAATLEDSAKRKVEVPADVRVVVPAGPPAQVLLHALAPDRLAALVEPFGEGDAIYVDAKLAALPTVPMLSRTSADAAVAAVAALKPGLVVDYGSVTGRFVATTEKTQAALHIPVVLFDGALADVATTVKRLGPALGAGQRADALAALAEDVLRQVTPVSNLPDGERARVYLARGTDGLDAARAGTSFDEPLRLAGGKNVVDGKGPTFRKMTVEEVVALKPDVVVFSTTEALSSPLRKALPKTTKVVLDAGVPYRVLAGPPSINWLVGLAALAPILHPEKVQGDRDTIARLETALFPIPPGLAVPAPLQVRE